MRYWTAVASSAQAEHEPAVAGNRDDASVGVGDLDADGGLEPVAEAFLVAAGHVLARPVDREGVACGEPRLGDFLDEEAVGRQRLADRLEVPHLRLDRLDRGFRRGRVAPELVRAGVAPVDGRAQLLDQRGRAEFRVRDHAGVGPDAHELGRIDVDPDGLHALGHPAPAEMHQLQAASDADQKVAFGPVLVSCAGEQPVGAVVSDHALAAAEAGDRRLDQLGERRHLLRGVLGSGADDDQRVARLADQPGDLLDPVGVGRGWRRDGPVHVEIDLRGLAEDIPRRLDRRRADAPPMHLAERLGHDPGRFGRMIDALGPPGEAAQGRQLVRQFVELAPPAADQVGHDIAGHAEHRRVGAIGDAERG